METKESDRRRGQARITTGAAFPRWRALKEEKGLRADTDVAVKYLEQAIQLLHLLYLSNGLLSWTFLCIFVTSARRGDKSSALQL